MKKKVGAVHFVFFFFSLAPGMVWVKSGRAFGSIVRTRKLRVGHRVAALQSPGNRRSRRSCVSAGRVAAVVAPHAHTHNTRRVCAPFFLERIQQRERERKKKGNYGVVHHVVVQRHSNGSAFTALFLSSYSECVCVCGN